MLNSTTANIVS